MTVPPSAGARWSPWLPSTAPRSKPSSAVASTTATGKSAKPPRTCWPDCPGLAVGSHEQDLQGVEGLEALAGAEDDALEGGVDEVHGDGRLLGDPSVEAPQHAAAADQVDALDDEVLSQLGRRRAQALHDGVDDGADLLVDRFAYFLGRQDHRLGQAAHQVASPHLGLDLVVRWEGRADGELDLLGRAFADGDAVLAADVGLDGVVDVEGPDADGLQGNDAAEGDHCCLGRTTADVDDHVPPRLVDREPGADGRSHRLLDELGLGGAGLSGR